LLKAKGSFRLRLQDDIGENVILSVSPAYRQAGALFARRIGGQTLKMTE